ncbi:MAG: hypothetical protein IPJ34_16020 [Myxococcales bacterium]|nr:hypothetical protein [Myxococcales bacterium]
MAEIRASWMPLYQSSLSWHGLLDLVTKRLSPATQRAFLEPAPGEWQDVATVVAVLDVVGQLRDAQTVRSVGRHVMRLALQSVLVAQVEPFKDQQGVTPVRLFEELPRLFAAHYRDAGEVRCLSTERHAAVTEIVGFRHASNPHWIEAWLGGHEGLLRHFRFAGRATADGALLPRALRVRTTWAGALSGAATALRPVITPVPPSRRQLVGGGPVPSTGPATGPVPSTGASTGPVPSTGASTGPVPVSTTATNPALRSRR